MADEGSGRAAEPLQLGGLERQQAQYMVDMRLHCRRPARPPCPHARAYIVDDRDRGTGGAHLSGDAQREVGAVDGHQAIRRFGDDGPCGLADAPHQPRQIGDDGGQTHDGDFAGVEKRNEALRRQVPAAEAHQPHLAGRSPPAAPPRHRRRAGRRIPRRPRWRSSARRGRSRWLVRFEADRRKCRAVRPARPPRDNPAPASARPPAPIPARPAA